ncbi:MAG TPA: diguanylate cyclase [Burkholderiales bacterium]|nr:diguanylate cyclase [Burkholderiales bacterium]
MRVLVVEDNPGDARLIGLVLEEGAGEAAAVTVARTLREALPLARAGGWDAVLLDLHLPDSAGLFGLRELALAVPRTPIVVLTGLDDDAVAADACAHGAQDYLVKGASGAVLWRALRCAQARKRFDGVLAERAHFDSLTGLANRALFLDRLAHAVQRAARAQERLAVLFLDLDGFKAINDAHGHALGDEVLRAVARALAAAVRESDTVARLGGDEFTVLAEGIGGAEQARALVERISAAFHAPLAVAGASLAVRASIGLAVFPDDAGDPQALLAHADAAMFRAKAAGGAAAGG